MMYRGPKFSLKLKTCACGLSTSTKQLRQYGACVRCVRAKTAAAAQLAA